MKSIITKALHPHINRFNRICLKCTPEGYNETFPLQYCGMMCKIHKDVEILLQCKGCQKYFNSCSYIFHSTSKNPCKKRFKNKSKKIKINKISGHFHEQKFSVFNILKNHYDETMLPKDECVNNFLAYIKKISKVKNNVSEVADEYFKFQKSYMKNCEIEDKKKKNIYEIVNLTERYNNDINKLSEVLNRSQRYDTRSKKVNNKNKNLNIINEKNKEEIEETMKNLNEILEEENLHYIEVNNKMKDLYNILVKIIDPLICNLLKKNNIK